MELNASCREAVTTRTAIGIADGTAGGTRPRRRATMMSSALSVFDGALSGSRTTLREHWSRCVPERELDRGAEYDWKSRELQATTIAWWEKLTGDLPIEAIGQADLDAFLVKLRAQPGRRTGTMAIATVRKHASTLRTILGQAAVTRGVKVRLPRRERKLAFGHFDLSDVAKMLQAGEYLRSPRPAVIGCTTAEWWRALIGWLFFTGARIEETLLTEWGHLRGDVIELPGTIRKLGVPHVSFVHPALMEWLQPLRQSGGQYIFGFGGRFAADGPARRNAIRALSRSHMAAVTYFGVRRSFGTAWHGYRKTHLSMLAQISPVAAELSSSHGGNSLLCRHYLDGTKILREAICKLPVPFPGSAPAPSGTGG